MIIELINIVAPVFMVIGTGYFWSKFNRGYDLKFVTSLVINIGCPCLVFSTLTNIQIENSMLEQMGIAAVVTLCLFGLIGFLILRVSGLSIHEYLSPLMFANIGNMGLPVCLYSFGDSGLALGIIVFALVTVGQFTISIWLYSGSVFRSGLYRNPVIISVIISIIILTARIEPPEWVSRPVEMLGNITIPMMLLALGVSLEGMRVINVKRAVLMSFARIAMGFAVGLSVSYLMGLTGAVRGVLVLQSSMPVAVFNYLLAERYGRKPSETAEIIVASTMMSIVTIPLILIFLKTI